jgi:hypothetical protein
MCWHSEIRFGLTNRTEAQCFYPTQMKTAKNFQQLNWARKPVTLLSLKIQMLFCVWIFVYKQNPFDRFATSNFFQHSHLYHNITIAACPEPKFLLKVLVSCNIKLTDLRTRYVFVQKQLSNYKMKFYHALQFIPQTNEWRNELISSCINLHRVTVVDVDMLGSRVATRRTRRDGRNYITPGLKRLASPTRLAVDRLNI